jgi:hypothetical protein
VEPLLVVRVYGTRSPNLTEHRFMSQRRLIVVWYFVGWCLGGKDLEVGSGKIKKNLRRLGS